MKKTKIIGMILGIILFILLVSGLTYAYLTWSSDKINYNAPSGCFDIFYTKGQDIGSDQAHANLMPSDDYTGGLSSSIKFSMNSKCTITSEGIIYLETLDTTSSNLYREGLLNYQVLKDGVVTNLKGSITSSGKIELNLGTLNKVSTEISATTYQVYVWIDNDLVMNGDVNSVYYGKVTAEARQLPE